MYVCVYNFTYLLVFLLVRAVADKGVENLDILRQEKTNENLFPPNKHWHFELKCIRWAHWCFHVFERQEKSKLSEQKLLMLNCKSLTIVNLDSLIFTWFVKFLRFFNIKSKQILNMYYYNYLLLFFYIFVKFFFCY